MAKLALLIGVSNFGEGYASLLTPIKNIAALQEVLLDPEKGAFNQVISISNPDPTEMEIAIDELFYGRSNDDVVLLYFSGHGDIDEYGNLYFTTRISRKNQQGKLLTTTALAANAIHQKMSVSSGKQQIVILDCCFSGAFAEGLIKVRENLGQRGRVILTSSTSIQSSFEEEFSPLSIYTSYLVEGIETGAADLDNKGAISIKNLHDYTAKKIKGVFPRMQPEIYALQPERLEIPIAKAPISEYKRNLQIFEKYLREEIERVLSQS